MIRLSSSSSLLVSNKAFCISVAILGSTAGSGETKTTKRNSNAKFQDGENWCIPLVRPTVRRHCSGTISQDPEEREGFPRALLNSLLLQPERKSPRPACSKSLQAFSQSSYQSVSNMLQQDYEGKDFVFIKDMAYCVEGKFDIFLEEGFKNFKHTFVIRNPEPAVSSLFKLSTNPELAGWDYFDPAEAGFRQLLELYEFIERHVHKDPVVVDADDLLKFPNEIMQSYCEAVDLQFDEHMTSWQAGPVAEWGPCTAWHDEVMKSSGFIAPVQEDTASPGSAVKDLPPEVTAAVKECTYALL
ncbi:hypothetical protein OS493_002631 [Desmophyllum pertusum]|uniref:Uncharacterized protein n=1 Tax=Desmophyllum pertusum TaxID=174260 RepID=A0A9W9YTI7_9CNID|nr:hypothetical protein OS493_002631 [Desmophyllum pertusum]